MDNDSWKNRTLIVGGVLGTLIGIAAAQMYVRAEQDVLETQRVEGPKHKPVPVVALLPIAIGLLGLLKQISELADRD